jgi:hypothetical protein
MPVVWELFYSFLKVGILSREFITVNYDFKR